MTPLRLRLLVACGLLLLAAGAVGFARVRHYVAEDPQFCASCHKPSPEFGLFSADGHSRVSCQSCHHTTPEQGLAMLSGFLRGHTPGQGGAHAPVEIGACAACHLTHDKEWAAQVGASRGHRVHAIEQKISCVRCHAAAVHRFEPPLQSCAGCHGKHAVGEKGMQSLHCLACHDFLSVEPTLRPTRRDCLRCHQRSGVHPARFPENAPMGFACAACHKPHAPPGEDGVACVSCHQDLAKSGLHGLDGHQACARCHRAHAWRSEREDCLRCHRAAASHHADRPTCSECHWFRASAGPAPALRPSPSRGK